MSLNLKSWPHFVPAKKKHKDVDIGLVRRGMALVLGLVGVLSIVSGAHFGRGFQMHNILVAPGTAWQAQHAVLVGFAFLYLARKVYQGESNAYRISLLLVLLQVIKYSLILPRLMPFLIYAFVLVTLIFSRDYFDRRTSPKSFLYRLRTAAAAIIAAIIVISLFGIVFRYHQPEDWQRSAYSASRIVMRVTLLEVTDHSKEPLSARLFGQALTTAGIAMYAWIVAGLFLPSLHSKRYADAAERAEMLKLIESYGTTSEDSFKLWPEDKHYWFTPKGTAGVAYKQYKGFVIALEAPVGSAQARAHAATSFRNYCRQHGWKLVWLFANETSAENNGLKTLTIGANAVVSLEKFATDTARNKWWRWIRNKNAKLGLVYGQAETPFSEKDLSEIRAINKAWLEGEDHVERTFGLGYYDEAFFGRCVMHVLRDENGVIVAFANQLPNFNGNTQATIDLMRSLPNYDGAISYLLSEILIGLHTAGYYKTFDLGFVPLAQTEETLAKKTALGLSTAFVETFFSARGLRQFKNKFEPTWHDNFLAWDGDWLDVPAIAQALDKVLTYDEAQDSHF
jgi:phosphatidylglycerol lysyltransferase